jgi:hypothetical protein
MNIILYTAGAHGRFLKFLFDCYTQGEILKTPFNKNGNSHNHNIIYRDNGDKFFSNTIEFYNYIRYFPNSMKKPNNLFHKYYKHFRREENLE